MFTPGTKVGYSEPVKLWLFVAIWLGLLWLSYRTGRYRYALLGLCLALWPLVW